MVCVARKKYVSDFETTTKIDDCRVWAYGYMEIGNKKNHHIGEKMEEFMIWCEKELCDIYFHNLKFDGSFIVNWLLHNGYSHSDSGLPKTFNTIISNMGQWYMIDICYGYKGKKKLHTKIYDSLKLSKAAYLKLIKGTKIGNKYLETKKGTKTGFFDLENDDEEEHQQEE